MEVKSWLRAIIKKRSRGMILIAIKNIEQGYNKDLAPGDDDYGDNKGVQANVESESWPINHLF